tara:strand:- start:3 stop:590 length:588 start_codon:yes stop_codon:yes gene_type:complete
VGRNIKVFQTLKNENPSYVEKEGPFICTWSNAWLGTGYYVWETFIDHAHWWGKTRLKDKYFICEASCILTDDNCFDLVGNTEHMSVFSEAIEEMKREEIVTHKTTVSRVLQFLKIDTELLKFEATRAAGFTSIGRKAHPELIKEILFEPKKYNKPAHYLNYRPPIQICLYSKTSLGLNGFQITYPKDVYLDDYVL